MKKTLLALAATVTILAAQVTKADGVIQQPPVHPPCPTCEQPPSTGYVSPDINELTYALAVFAITSTL